MKQQYNRQDLKKAVQECKDGKMSMRAAGDWYGVPFQTISRHVRKTYPDRWKGWKVDSFVTGNWACKQKTTWACNPISTIPAPATLTQPPTTCSTPSVRSRRITSLSASAESPILAEYSNAICDTLFNIFQSKSTPKPARVVKVKRAHHGMSLTQDDVVKYLQEAEEKKKNKKMGKQKPKSQASTSSHINDTQLSEPNVNKPVCLKWRILLEDNLSWRACENSACKNRICTNCLPPKIKKKSSLEYFCGRKCSKN